MLTILGDGYRFCDGLSRRSFLTIGALAVGGLSLPELLRAEARAGQRSSRKSVIMVFLPGGPSHIDMYDLKPDAPAEYRGEFQPIPTSVPGIQICELLPQLARCMDKWVAIRSIVGGVDDHACHLCFTGHSRLGPQPAGNWPSAGSVVARLLGPTELAVPSFIGLAAPMLHPPYNDPGPGFLGAGYGGFTPDGQTRANMTLNGITRERLHDRRALLTQFDGLRRDIDSSGTMLGMDRIRDRALAVLTSSRLRDALDLSQEEPNVRDRYGPGDPSLVTGFNAAPRLTEHLLLARRLVEAGARLVTLAFGAWDWHEKNFEGLRQQMPLFDQGVSALVEDLSARGLDRDVLLVVWGEFGRTPKVNKSAGRDHWPAVSCASLAGGGFAGGQVIGSTTRLGEFVKDRPVHFQEVLATVYHHLGIDIARTTLSDLAGRPQYLLENPQPVRELVSS